MSQAMAGHGLADEPGPPRLSNQTHPLWLWTVEPSDRWASDHAANSLPLPPMRARRIRCHRYEHPIIRAASPTHRRFLPYVHTHARTRHLFPILLANSKTRARLTCRIDLYIHTRLVIIRNQRPQFHYSNSQWVRVIVWFRLLPRLAMACRTVTVATCNHKIYYQPTCQLSRLTTTMRYPGIHYVANRATLQLQSQTYPNRVIASHARGESEHCLELLPHVKHVRVSSLQNKYISPSRLY
jgi:hypothetical protein